MENLNFLLLKDKDIHEYRDEIAKLRIEIFHDFPYLYEGDYEYEKKYLKVYEESSRSILVLVMDGNTAIGASTALPLSDENDYIQEPFLKLGLEIENFFYFGESVLKKNYRGLGIGKKFFQHREQHALSFPQYKFTCFCGVNRPENHKSRPKDYIPLDDFWSKLGYHKEPKIISSFSWRDIGDIQETEKPMTYWLKEWKR